MAYQVYFSDSTSIQQHSLTVVDKTINTQTSLTFLGRNYANYSEYIAENFLKLLENFSNTTAPTKAVQGQLWYDSKNHTLMVNSGSTGNWISASGVTKNTIEPSSATLGDLWVDTFNKQLKIYNGLTWDLIGPQFTQGLFAGAKVEEVYDDTDVKHTIISLYSDNLRMAVVSGSSFTPKSTIIGFANFSPGINLINSEEGVVQTSHRFRGTATDSDRLGGYLASEFIRTTSSNSIVDLNVKQIYTGFDNLLTVGSPSATTDYFISSNSSRAIDVRIDNRSLAYFSPSGNVGIRTQSPTSTLDVNGMCTTLGLTSNSIENVEIDPERPQTASVQIAGGVSIGKSVLINNDVYISDGTITLSKLLPVNGPRPVVVPAQTRIFDLGSEALQFKTLYTGTVIADEFKGKLTGSLIGTVNGSVTGTATALANPSKFSLTGDIVSIEASYTGAESSVTMATSLSDEFINSKLLTTTAKSSDEILVYRPDAEQIALFNGYISGTTLVVTTLVSGELSIGATITGTDLTPGNEVMSGTKIVGGPRTESSLQVWDINYSQTMGDLSNPFAIAASAHMFKETRKTFLQTVAVTGAVILFAGSAIPSGYLECNGGQYSISMYPELADMFDPTDPSVFNVPDLTASAPSGLKYIIFTGKL